jgi:peptidoglycan lytic transglycosylase
MKLRVMCCICAMISGFPVYGAARMADPGQVERPRVQYGVASWYGDREQGRPMACGEPFNEYAMVAAHRTLPLGTEVRVTNMRNGRSVVVRIMDRGPHVAGRAIDLSKAAAERLRFTHQGLAPVRIRVLNKPIRQRREAELTRRPGPRKVLRNSEHVILSVYGRKSGHP